METTIIIPIDLLFSTIVALAIFAWCVFFLTRHDEKPREHHKRNIVLDCPFDKYECSINCAAILFDGYGVSCSITGHATVIPHAEYEKKYDEIEAITEA
jgi:hypothetical protein